MDVEIQKIHGHDGTIQSQWPPLLRAFLGVFLGVPGLIGLIMCLDAFSKWMTVGFDQTDIHSSTDFVPLALILLLISITAFGIVLRFARWKTAPTASLVLAIAAIFLTVLAIEVLPNEPGKLVGALVLSVPVLLITALPPFLHWWKLKNRAVVDLASSIEPSIAVQITRQQKEGKSETFLGLMTVLSIPVITSIIIICYAFFLLTQPASAREDGLFFAFILAIGALGVFFFGILLALVLRFSSWSRRYWASLGLACLLSISVLSISFLLSIMFRSDQEILMLILLTLLGFLIGPLPPFLHWGKSRFKRD